MFRHLHTTVSFLVARCDTVTHNQHISNSSFFWDRPKLSMSLLTQSHQVFFGRPLGLKHDCQF